MKRSHTLAPAALIASMALVLTACGNGSTEEGAPESEGFEHGASQEEVNAAIEDLEPVEITYQGAGQSPNSVVSISDMAIKDYIEERSNGQITVDMVWGQAIAGYDEVEDALMDGRVDIAWTLPVYDPTQYPAFDGIVTATAGMPSSPVLGELVAEAVVADLAANSEQVLAEYEAVGLTPLLPMASSGAYHSMCAEEGTSPDDWRGRTIRIGNSAHEVQAQNLGGNPTSLPYTEMFEALQRGTIDCTFGALRNSEEAGLLEVATHLALISEEHSMSGRGTGAVLGGTGYQNLPLPYQQIIFDAMEARYAAAVESLAEGNAAGIEQVKGAGGEIVPIDPEADEIIGETNVELIENVEESGVLEPGIADRSQESITKWSDLAEELGYTEEGGYEDLDEWFDMEDYDFSPMAERFFEDVLLPLRPE
jgi:TRAP-type C4-dicarboxylate transport system substrate-binding protein